MYAPDHDRLYTAGAIAVAAVTVLLLIYYVVLFVEPTSDLNPFPPQVEATIVAAVPVTPTLPPTWTPEATASATATTTVTPRPTLTSNPTATPTDRPIPTETPIPLPTSTPGPTPTPQPPLYLHSGMFAGPDCTWTGVFGVVWTVTDLPREGVQVHLWTEQGLDLYSPPTDVDGNYVIQVSGEPVAARWFMEVLEGGVPQSEVIIFETSLGCQNGLQKFRVDWRRTQ